MYQAPYMFLKMMAIMATMVAGISMAQDYEIVRSTMDGGGVMCSTGGGFELSGTIGQPDAGPASGMMGGSFTLTGGFWFPLVPGDCNSDGGVNLLDYSDFETCVFGPQAGIVVSKCFCFDSNGDDRIEIRDYGSFQLTLQLP